MTLIATDDLVTYLGLNLAGENVDRLEQVVQFANDWMIDRTGRDWVQTTRTELLRGNGQKELVLRHYPVKSITSITLQNGGLSTTLDATNPQIVDLVNPEQGVLARTDGNKWDDMGYRYISIVYVGGPLDAPGYLTTATLEVAAYLYQTTGGRGSVSTPDASVSFQSLGDKALLALPAVKEALILAADVL